MALPQQLRAQKPVAEGLFHIPTGPGDRAYLIGSRCTKCSEYLFPRSPVCPACVSVGTTEDVEFSGRGKIWRFIVTDRGPTGFQVPYIQAWLRLDEGPIIYSIIRGCPPTPDALSRGEEVEMKLDTIRVDETGTEIIGWTFVPLRTDSHG
jgi:uncharacterized OB-fold protein